MGVYRPFVCAPCCADSQALVYCFVSTHSGAMDDDPYVTVQGGEQKVGRVDDHSNRTLVPVTVKQVIDAQEDGGLLCIHNRTAHCDVALTAAITSMTSASTHMTFVLADGTGTIRAVLWTFDEDAPDVQYVRLAFHLPVTFWPLALYCVHAWSAGPTCTTCSLLLRTCATNVSAWSGVARRGPAWSGVVRRGPAWSGACSYSPGQYVQVFGTMRVHDLHRSVVVHSIKPVLDFNSVTYHNLAAMHAAALVAAAASVLSGGASAAGAKAPACAAAPPRAVKEEFRDANSNCANAVMAVFEAKSAAAGDAGWAFASLSTLRRLLLSWNATLSRGHSRALVRAELSQTCSTLFDVVARRVCRLHDGVVVKDLASRFNAADVNSAVSQLSEEGQIYATIDDDHYLPT